MGGSVYFIMILFICLNISLGIRSRCVYVLNFRNKSRQKCHDTALHIAFASATADGEDSLFN